MADMLLLRRQAQKPSHAHVSRNVPSPVSGHLISCLVKVGDRVEVDTEVGIIEAMKMHIPVVAEKSGRVSKWLVGENSTVAEGQPLLELAPL
ncbi:MAG TPA: acetyl-CoA carboxylase biotin carboxyl carrier protein subunit [Hyphomicrobiaceae bacterium]|nr:acetyl-CoA carboxylase biotin carboxyl carrier protein subunit [Hyphomicrobiaceae bacterium]